MFANACKQVRESLYGIMAISQVNPVTVTATTGTGFMISPGFIVTAAHLVHVDSDPAKPRHQRLEVIRSPDIGSQMLRVAIAAEDAERDIVLLRADASASTSRLRLLASLLPVGTPCGSLGFPLGSVEFREEGPLLHLVERFQGASISAIGSPRTPKGRTLPFYETDSLMYKGSSGCPGFDSKGRCFGMHVRSAVERIQPGGTGPLAARETRVAISLWVPSTDIIEFARSNGAPV
jgi:hypothetical protein